MTGVTRYGIPDRIRSDQGGENIGVIAFMIREHSGLIHGHPRPAIVGTSVRNQRIEAFFNHVNTAVTDAYKRTFDEWAFRYPDWFPNGLGIRFCLQYLFLERINEDIDRFVNIWNNHRMGHLSNRTPFQVFTDPQANRINIPYAPDDTYGVDYEDGGYDTDQDDIEAMRRPLDQVSLVFFVHMSVMSYKLPYYYATYIR